jgi:hypothetical protein
MPVYPVIDTKRKTVRIMLEMPIEVWRDLVALAVEDYREEDNLIISLIRKEWKRKDEQNV